VRLLLRAVRSLPEREQDVVLAYLLERRPSDDDILVRSPRPEIEPRRVVSPELTGTRPELAGTRHELWGSVGLPWWRWGAALILRRLAAGVAVDELAAELGLGAETLSATLRDLAGRSHPSPRLAEIFGRLAEGKTIAQAADELDLSEAQLAAELEPSEALLGGVCAALTARAAMPGPPSGYLGSLPQGSLRTMPVRFPEQQYQRLKDWCEKHGFPMAVVVRGLVERFLDEQERRGA
jgi:transcriptional regulator with XRE-family HTH domain